MKSLPHVRKKEILEMLKRSDYIDAWFNVANWDKAGENYNRCIRNRGYLR